MRGTDPYVHLVCTCSSEYVCESAEGPTTLNKT